MIVDGVDVVDVVDLDKGAEGGHPSAQPGHDDGLGIVLGLLLGYQGVH